jgi:hypothetical protein
MHFPVENFEGKNSIFTLLEIFRLFFSRAFESILKCHRTRYRPSVSFNRISTTTINEQMRLEKSHSCDITSSHSFRKSDSMISYRTSCDSQRQFIPLNKNQRFLDRPQLSVFRRISNPTSSKSSISFDNGNPWHLREPNFVR